MLYKLPDHADRGDRLRHWPYDAVWSCPLCGAGWSIPTNQLLNMPAGDAMPLSDAEAVLRIRCRTPPDGACTAQIVHPNDGCALDG